MVINKQDLIKAIDIEYEDRSTQARESGEENEYTEELNGLLALKESVINEQPLDYDHYEWLCYLVANQRENDIREELE